MNEGRYRDHRGSEASSWPQRNAKRFVAGPRSIHRRFLIIDGENCILGRLATAAAKAALSGEEVRIVNAEKILITGNPSAVVAKYRVRLSRKDKASPWKSAKLSRRPDLFVRRAIRGMLPRKSRRGAAALRRIIAYMGEPEEFRGKAKKVAEAGKSGAKTIRVSQVCTELGWNGG